jgi:hypothetical protein
MPISLYRVRIHMASFVVFTNNLYLDSVENNAMQVCFLVLQVIGVSLIAKMKAPVDLR